MKNGGADARRHRIQRQEAVRRRWRLLAQALFARNCADPLNGGSLPIDSVVRDLNLFALFHVQPLPHLAEPKAAWFRYELKLADDCASRKSATIRHPTTAGFTVHQLAGFNNTGNVRLWPSEEVLAYVALKNCAFFAGKSVLEVGGGMSCLAGLLLALHAGCSRVRLTDGHPAAVENVARIWRANMAPDDCADLAPNDCANLAPNDRADLRPDDCANMAPDDCANMAPDDCANMALDDCANLAPNDRADLAPNGCADLTPDDCANTAPDDCANVAPDDCADCASEVLVWSEYGRHGRTYDVIVAADCLFFDDCRTDLVRLVEALLRPSGVALMVAPRRGESLRKFVSAARARGFRCSVRSRYDEVVWRRHSELKARSAFYDEDVHFPLLVVMTRASNRLEADGASEGWVRRATPPDVEELED